MRVLKPNGVLAAVPMYYLREPSEEMLIQVRAAIQTEVQAVNRDYWLDFYAQSNLVLKYVENYRFDYIQDKVLDSFVQTILSRPFLQELDPEVFGCLKKKYKDYIYLFRDNLSYMGYSILLYKNELYNTEPELFRGSFISCEEPK